MTDNAATAADRRNQMTAVSRGRSNRHGTERLDEKSVSKTGPSTGRHPQVASRPETSRKSKFRSLPVLLHPHRTAHEVFDVDLAAFCYPDCLEIFAVPKYVRRHLSQRAREHHFLNAAASEHLVPDAGILFVFSEHLSPFQKLDPLQIFASQERSSAN